MSRNSSAVALLSLYMVLTVVGCSSGGGAGSLVPAPDLNLAAGIKQLQFTWEPVDGATHYRLFENPDGISGFTQVGGDLTETSLTLDIAAHRLDWTRARYLLEACDSIGCGPGDEVAIQDRILDAVGYFEASDTIEFSQFGLSVTLSRDGRVVAVGAPFEGSIEAGIDEGQNGAVLHGLGAVHVFARDEAGAWGRQAHIEAPNRDMHTFFGTAVALSADGRTLAVGSGGADADETEIDELETEVDRQFIGAGAVHVFTSDADGAWGPHTYIRPANLAPGDWFGDAVSLNDAGDLLAVGAPFDDGGTGGISPDRDPNDNAAWNAGAVYVFNLVDEVWAQQAYIKASNASLGDWFGGSVALSADGSTLAVGASRENSAATGVNGDQDDGSADNAGAVYVFIRDDEGWMQQAYIKASNTSAEDRFGWSVALDSGGNTLAVGAPLEGGLPVGVGDGPAGAVNTGAVYLFDRSDNAEWIEQEFLKASDFRAEHRFGAAVALSHDGNTLAVGTSSESGQSTGVDRDQENRTAAGSGAVYIYRRDILERWEQQNFFVAPHDTESDRFGHAVALNEDGNSLVVGTIFDDANIEVGGAALRQDIAAQGSAVYLY